MCYSNFTLRMKGYISCLQAGNGRFSLSTTKNHLKEDILCQQIITYDLSDQRCQAGLVGRKQIRRQSLHLL